MNTVFCLACGAKHSFTFAAPKFCPNCGVAIGSTKKLTPPPTTRRRSRAQEEEIDDEEEGSDVDYVPDIDGVSVEIEQDEEGIKAQSLGNILQQTNEGPYRVQKRSLDLDQLKQSRGK